MHVVRVSAGAVEQTYDLTIEGAHEFFANGVLVHNSIDTLRYIVYSDRQGSAKGKPRLQRVVKDAARHGVFLKGRV